MYLTQLKGTNQEPNTTKENVSNRQILAEFHLKSLSQNSLLKEKTLTLNTKEEYCVPSSLNQYSIHTCNEKRNLQSRVYLPSLIGACPIGEDFLKKSQQNVCASCMYVVQHHIENLD